MTRILATVLAYMLLMAAPQAAETGPQTRSVEAPFEDVLLDLQDAVIGRGLVIDYIGHVDKMLERTAETALGAGGRSPYLNAKYMQFCSAKLTHEAVGENPANLSICPYLVYLFETEAAPGTVQIGYRKPVFATSASGGAVETRINEFLQEIVDEAAGATN